MMGVGAAMQIQKAYKKGKLHGKIPLNEYNYKRVKSIATLPGATDTRICRVLGISLQVLKRWQKEHPDFARDLEDWRDRSNKQVERALFERAIGYGCEEERVVSGVLGPQVVTIRKQYPPDVNAAILWLKNRDPERWCDKQEHGFTDKDGNDLQWEVVVRPARGNILYDGDEDYATD